MTLLPIIAGLIMVVGGVSIWIKNPLPEPVFKRDYPMIPEEMTEEERALRFSPLTLYRMLAIFLILIGVGLVMVGLPI